MNVRKVGSGGFHLGILTWDEGNLQTSSVIK